MAGQYTARIALLAGLLAALSGCVTETGKKAVIEAGSETVVAGGDGGAPIDSGSGEDVEAPSAFNLTDTGLWDGRPSLGGIWVAHPTVTEPERVVIRNAANGNSVVGALFRREIANPGPRLQVSSDAATALGMLAGQPAELSVVALRKKEAPPPPAAAPAAPAATAATVPEGGAAEPVAEAAAEAAEASPPAAAGEGASDVGAIAATAAAAIDAAEGKSAEGADAAAAEAGEETAAPKCPFWRRKKCLAEAAAGLPDPAAGAGAPIAAGDGTVTAAPLPDPAADTIPASEASASTLRRPFVQAGYFSTAENAQRAADGLRAAGLTAAVRSGESQGKAFWRVVVGPAATEAERDAMAAKAKELGYPDAYPVSE